jgi:O-antigen ligase
MYPRFRRVALIAAAIALIVLSATGFVGEKLEYAQQRLTSDGSDQSALSRLPVAVASLRMLEERPLEGWGYGRFDDFDRDFQVEVGGFFPQKDHVSHNVYLTIAAEQGTIGIFLFLAPLVGAAGITARAWRKLPASGFWSRRLMAALWLTLVAHVIVNNFADAQTAVGPGLWWVTLGLIVSIGRRRPGTNRRGVMV